MPINLFSQLTSKIFGGLLIVSLITLGPALLITRHHLSNARDTIAALETWRSEIIKAVRMASENDDVTAKTAAGQINELGFVRIRLRNAVDSQNAAIDALARESQVARETAAKAARERAAAIKRAEALAKELRDRARVPAPASDMEASVRTTQDKLYEAGL